MPTPTKGPRLGGSPTHERHMLNNLSAQLFQHKRITTTLTKAKRLRPVAERFITFGKKGDLAARRRVLRSIADKSVVHELFTVIAPAMAERPGGYTRIIKIGNRKGDNAPMAVIELVMEPVASKGAVAEATKVAEKAAEAPKAEAPKAEAAEGQPAGSHAPLESGEAPEGFEVKGNADSMKYHVPGSRWYSSTKAEIWFDSAESAEAAGYAPAGGAAAQKVSE
ncbi:MAG: 50S ribosomal protein L17 [Rothia mucilaginosa]|uniref:Large ribosomal subunit protein bL17 n=1 Tax=Rothia mucilaginosa TaxID=43675 RepID=A0A930LP58_9MICC|nr:MULTISPECIES: 50S ribosomal protein L17 [Rothia]MBF1672826.1 50S ribosomal protein L17 [Rothia mucilaginosa]MBF1675631.1 50S ribosomal protein L17 [Rothia sp. (in: high G+C Gram-positive bacteria)]MBS4946323.1 50S ribosomal protein L17 [Rothia mucilaginosa]MDU6366278.1 50S ribosomal protein L17 [Rothia mucilaginosa]OFM98524.1 50S ribosomal protein L17 [Rothia sp. HMSC072B03]